MTGTHSDSSADSPLDPSSASHGSLPDLDVDFIRSQFPAFSEPTLDGWAFFENAGGSYTCSQVIDRLTTFYRRLKVQPYSPYPASSEAGDWMDESYRTIAGYLNVEPDELHFGPSTSQNTYVLANAFAAPGPLVTGGEIIVSNQDHEANAGVWRRMADRSGLVMHEWKVDPETGRLSLDDLDALLSDRTRLVVFPHASNVVAHVNPVAEISARAHAVGAWTVVDGVSYAPHGLPDVDGLGADVYLFSMYKTWGPHLGAMVVRQPLWEQLANQGHYFNEGKAHYTITPAGPDHAQIASAAGVAHYLDAVYGHHFGPASDADPAERGRRVHDLFRTYEEQLLAPLLAWLRDRNDLRIVGPADPSLRAPTVAVCSAEKPVEELQKVLTAKKLMVGTGDFYAVRPLMGMNIPTKPGVLRLSFVHYTTMDEVDRLIEGLSEALG